MLSSSVQLYRATLLHTRATKLREEIAGVTSVLGLQQMLKVMSLHA